MRTKTNSGKAKPGHCNLVAALFTIRNLSFNVSCNFRHAIYETEVAVWITRSSHIEALSASLCIQLVIHGAQFVRQSRRCSKAPLGISNKQSPATAGCEGQTSGYVQVTGMKLCSPSPCHCLGCYACNISSWAYPAANRAFFFSQRMLGKHYFGIESKSTVKWPQASFGLCCSVLVVKRSELLCGSYSV